MACSIIYDGFYAGICEPDKTWDKTDKVVGYDDATAREIVGIALSYRGTDEQKAHGLTRKVVRRDYMSLEVIEVLPGPSPAQLPKGADKSLPENKYFRGTQTLGKLRVKPWIPEDPTTEEQHELPKNQIEVIDIWLEKTILQFCFPGMHMEARVHRCDDGLVFIDSVTVKPIPLPLLPFLT